MAIPNINASDADSLGSSGGAVGFYGGSIGAKSKNDYTKIALIIAGVFVAYIAAKKFKII